MKRFLLADDAATQQFGRLLADALPAAPRGWQLTLSGELGAGKSTLARAMIRQFGHRGPVPSPTYTLIEPYDFEDFSLYHVDLYRIADPEELDFLGWSDLEHGLRLVEWPERVSALSESADIAVALTISGTGRAATLQSLSKRGADVVAQIHDECVSTHSGLLA